MQCGAPNTTTPHNHSNDGKQRFGDRQFDGEHNLSRYCRPGALVMFLVCFHLLETVGPETLLLQITLDDNFVLTNTMFVGRL